MTPTRPQFRCDNDRRREAVRASATLNGIDFLEVVDQWAKAHPGSPQQRTLLVHLFKAVPAAFDAGNVRISGGERVTDVGVTWAYPAAAIPVGKLTPAEAAFIAAMPDVPKLLVVRVDQAGDFSRYRLSLLAGLGRSEPPAGFDARLSEVDFSFKVECPTPFDCQTEQACPPVRVEEPHIDYLAKDYSSFRRLMLDRLSVTMPAWTERSEADIGVTLVELLAYAGDHLSYFQDALATEAYLGTARRRVSVRRHARLLDYPMHDGANARAWVAVNWLGPPAVLPAGTPLLTGAPERSCTLDARQYAEAISQGALVFETLHPLPLFAALNEIDFYTWGDDKCCLPRGATRATLVNDGGRLAGLAPGAVLIFEEVLAPEPGLAPDPARRHPVRLTAVEAATDPLYGEATGAPQQRLVEIQWHPDDALPFPLCLWRIDTGATHQGAGAGRIVPGGTNLRGLRIAVRIDTAGAPGVAKFSWSGDGGKTWAPSQTVPAGGTFNDGTSGVSATFTGDFAAGDVYAFGPAPASVARGNVVLADHGRTLLQFAQTPGPEGTPQQRVDHSGAGAGTVYPANPGVRAVRVVVLIVAGGDPGVATFAWSNDAGANFGAAQTIPATGSFTDGGSGITVMFTGTFAAGDLYRFAVVSETLPPPPAKGPVRIPLARGPLSQQRHVRDAKGHLLPFLPTAPAAAAFPRSMGEMQPAISLADPTIPQETWSPRRDLLESGPPASDFVAEVENDGTTLLRFGDGVLGRRPPRALDATYRVGNGAAGNVGADSIRRVAGVAMDAANPTVPSAGNVLALRNPLPASGGADPETIDQVKLYAPQAFRTNQRAVTVDDYATVAERHPDVAKAVATRRWTGSWTTIFIAIDRRGGRPVDDPFRSELRAFIEGYRLACQDVEIAAPAAVPLLITLVICVDARHFRGDVLAGLREALGSRELPDGRRGFFHPDNLTFGQPVYLSQIAAAALRVPGVVWIDFEDPRTRFQRLWDQPNDELAIGVIAIGPLEIAQLDADPSLPERGQIDFVLKGGL